MTMDLLIIMTKYTLILAPLEVFAKRTFLGQGPETAALPDPEQMKITSRKHQATSVRHFVAGQNDSLTPGSSIKRQAVALWRPGIRVKNIKRRKI